MSLRANAVGPRRTLRVAGIADLETLAHHAATRSRDETDGFALVLSEEVGRLPDAGLLGRLFGSGLTDITVEGTRSLTANRPLETLAFLRFLRDASSSARPVEWRGGVGLGAGTRLLSHLVPPAPGGDGGADDEATRWRAEHRFASLYWRLGPDFISIKDTRPGATPYRLVLDDQPIRTMFRALQEPVRLDDLSTAERAAVEVLVTERLVLQLDPFALSLPYRLRYWPIACSGVTR